MTRLTKAVADSRQAGRFGMRTRSSIVWHLLKWLTPVTATAAVLGMFAFHQRNGSLKTPPGSVAISSAAPSVKADNVEIDQQWVATFDAVAHMPNGEPVRFRCSEWFDDVVLRDSTKNLLIQHRMPRIEVDQVSFETY
jgi:hypothetical protein